MHFFYRNKEFFTKKDLGMCVIGGRWKISIIWHLLNSTQPLRLSELEKKIPDINQRMLIRQLRELEEDKVIERTVYPVVPPKADYHLTPIGEDLAPVVEAICDWSDSYYHFVEEKHQELL